MPRDPTMHDPNRFPGLPDIPPHPEIRLTTWAQEGETRATTEYRTKVRRAFIQNLVTDYPLSSMEEVNEAILMRFGARVAPPTIMKDMRVLGIVRVPMPGGGFRYKLASQVSEFDLDMELNDRLRLDALSIKRGGANVYIEVNRGTASAVVQILNLFIDDATLPDVLGITSDGDKWVVLNMEGVGPAKRVERWLTKKLS